MINGMNALSLSLLGRGEGSIERNRPNQRDNENGKTKIGLPQIASRSDSRKKKGDIFSIEEIK
jgi:hypothetical protein